MASEETEVQNISAVTPVPDWLRGLIRAVRREAMQPKDARVKSLWDLLRRQGLLTQSPWLRAVLRRIWSRGLAVRSRPRTTKRLVRLLRGWGILPVTRARATTAGPVSVSIQPQVTLQPIRPVIVRPIRPPRPVTIRPVRPITVRPAVRAGARR
jgi:hypothetical protein